MKLYELTDMRLEALSNTELDEADLESIAGIEMAIDEKALNIALVIKDLTALADAYDEEILRMNQRCTSIEKRIDWLKKYLSIHLDHPVKSVKAEIAFRKSESVEVLDIYVIPSKYLREKTIIEPDKNAIKQAIKDGIRVNGVEIIENRSVVIK